MTSIIKAIDEARKAYCSRSLADLTSIRNTLIALSSDRSDRIDWRDVMRLVGSIQALNDRDLLNIALRLAAQVAGGNPRRLVELRRIEAISLAANGDLKIARSVIEDAMLDARMAGLEDAIPALRLNLAAVASLQGRLDELSRLIEPEHAAFTSQERLGAVLLAAKLEPLDSLEVLKNITPGDVAATDEYFQLMATAQILSLSCRSAIAQGSIEKALRAADGLELCSQRLCSDLGYQHPLSATVLADFAANVYEISLQSGMPSLPALERLEIAAHAVRYALGSRHYRTISAQANYLVAAIEFARMHDDLGLLAQSVHDLDACLRLANELLGASHPQVAVILANLATAESFVARKDRTPARIESAILRLEQAATSSERILGGDHAATRILRRELAACRYIGGQGLSDVSGGVATKVIAPAAADDEAEDYVPFSAAERYLREDSRSAGRGLESGPDPDHVGAVETGFDYVEESALEESRSELHFGRYRIFWAEVNLDSENGPGSFTSLSSDFHVEGHIDGNDLMLFFQRSERLAPGSSTIELCIDEQAEPPITPSAALVDKVRTLDLLDEVRKARIPVQAEVMERSNEHVRVAFREYRGVTARIPRPLIGPHFEESDRWLTVKIQEVASLDHVIASRLDWWEKISRGIAEHSINRSISLGDTIPARLAATEYGIPFDGIASSMSDGGILTYGEPEYMVPVAMCRLPQERQHTVLAVLDLAESLPRLERGAFYHWLATPNSHFRMEPPIYSIRDFPRMAHFWRNYMSESD